MKKSQRNCVEKTKNADKIPNPNEIKKRKKLLSLLIIQVSLPYGRCRQ